MNNNLIEVTVGVDGKGITHVDGHPAEVLPALANAMGHIFAHFGKVPPLEDLMEMSVEATCNEPFMLQVSESNTGFGGCEECLLSAVADVMKAVATSLELDARLTQDLYEKLYEDAKEISVQSAEQVPEEKQFSELDDDIKAKMGMLED